MKHATSFHFHFRNKKSPGLGWLFATLLQVVKLPNQRDRPCPVGRPIAQYPVRGEAFQQMKRTQRTTPGKGTAFGPAPHPTEMSPLHGHWHVGHFSAYKQLWCRRMRSPSRDTLLIALATACIFKERETNQPSFMLHYSLSSYSLIQKS